MSPQTTDPRQQAMFDKIGQQALALLTTEDAADMMANDAKANGAAPALANALGHVIDGIRNAAGTAGVQIPPQVLQEITRVLAGLLVGLMAQSGLAEDPDAVMAELAPMLQQRLGGGPEQDPEEQGEVYPPGMPPGMEEVGEPPRRRQMGALSGMAQGAM